MRCSVSPTTSTAADDRGSRVDARPTARDAAAQFEGLLFAQAFAPLAKPLGFLGETVVATVATDVAEHGDDALARHLTTTIAGEVTR